MKKALVGNQGIALVVVLMVMMLLLSVAAGGLLFSGLNLKTTSSFRTGTSALQVADAGIEHALAEISLGSTFAYSSSADVASGSIGATTYTVTAINDSTSSGGNTRAILTSTALGPNSAKKAVEAYVDRSTAFAFGSVSLPGSSADATETYFSGNSFTINGNDNCGVASAVPGIAVTDAALGDEITNNTTSDGGLESGQMDNVTGAGGTPSVSTMSPLSMSVSDLAAAYLANSHVTLSEENYSGNDNWGTSETPQITRLTESADIQGTIEGYGVLIVEGSLDISGNFTFHGLVIALGDIEVEITGHAGIYGSLVIGESTTQDAGYELDVRGNATIQYDSCALSSAESWSSLPKAAKLIAWREKLS